MDRSELGGAVENEQSKKQTIEILRKVRQKRQAEMERQRQTGR